VSGAFYVGTPYWTLRESGVSCMPSLMKIPGAGRGTRAPIYGGRRPLLGIYVGGHALVRVRVLTCGPGRGDGDGDGYTVRLERN
jgi:hypothetical protein